MNSFKVKLLFVTSFIRGAKLQVILGGDFLSFRLLALNGLGQTGGAAGTRV